MRGTRGDELADSNANIAIERKTFTYVPPTPPAELIESSSFTLDFATRKFIHVGIDATENFQVVVHLITSSRYVKLKPDFLRRIFSLMGNILSFILDQPQKYKRVIFLETEQILLSSMVYNGENVLVIRSKILDGCRVLLNRADLTCLQYMENCIFESITRKELVTTPQIIKQTEEFSAYLNEKCARHESPPKKFVDMLIFIKNMEDDRSDRQCPNFTSQIQRYAAIPLAESALNHIARNSHESFFSPISPLSSPSPMSTPPPPPTSSPPSFATPSRAVDQNDGPSFYNMRPSSETYDSALSEIYFVPKRSLF